MTKNIVWYQNNVTRIARQNLNRHRSIMIWFTGLSGAGKSTLASAVEAYLHELQYRTYMLDGDNVRHGLNSDLGFSLKDRDENLRRIGEVGKLMVDAGVITLAAFISPLEEERANVRRLFARDDFIEVYCNASLDVCETRDTKGMYKKAREGKVLDFTGVSSPYEAPISPDITVNTGTKKLEDCVYDVIDELKKRGLVPLTQN